jgi:hypothetical protein
MVESYPFHSICVGDTIDPQRAMYVEANQRRLMQRSPGSPPPSSIGFIWTESGSRAHDNPSATISPPPSHFYGVEEFIF